MKTVFYQNKTDAERRKQQAVKFARILYIYQNGGTIPELAKKLNVSTRTVRRDMKVIEIAKQLGEENGL